MKTFRITAKQIIAVLAVMTFAFAAFAAGVYVGGRDRAGDYSVNTQRGEAFVFEVTKPEQSAAQASQAPELPEGRAVININTATAEELTGLDGIGPALAERIIAYREETGGFKHAFEIMDVQGIGENKYLAIKDKITVGE
jgi:competence protein ComEA